MLVILRGKRINRKLFKCKPLCSIKFTCTAGVSVSVAFLSSDDWVVSGAAKDWGKRHYN